MATLRKIKLHFFWADESVWVEDNQKKISKSMIDWGNAFYKDYGFVFDVEPKSIDSLKKAKPYCLAKSDGVRPEIDFRERTLQERDDEEAVIEAKIKKIEDEMAAEDRRRQQLTAEQEALRAELDALPPGSPARDAIRDKIHEKYDKIMASYNVTMPKYDEISAQRAEIEKITKKYEKLLIDADHATKLQKILMQKFDVDDIGNTDRVSIVFCRFKTVEGMLTMRKKHPGYGITHYAQHYFHDGALLWYYPFIVVNIQPHERITIAHEIVHAAGRRHPDARKVIRDVEAFFNYKPKPLRGSLINMAFTVYENYLEYESFFEMKEGGWFHGRSNDIMNYDAKGREPGQVVLHPDDQVLMEKAYFVEPNN